MDSQCSNNHLLEANCNHSFEQKCIPVIDASVPNSIWKRETCFPGSSEQPPLLGQRGWSVEALKPVQTWSSQQDADMKEDQVLSGTLGDIKQFESQCQTEHVVSSLQLTTADVTADTVAAAMLVSTDSTVMLPGDPNNASSDKVKEGLAKDDAGEVSGEEEEEVSYWVPKVLWTQEMIDLHARVKVLSRKCSRKRDDEMLIELKMARGKFKYWYKRMRASMLELPDFEELKKIAIEEKKNVQKKKAEQRKEEEERRMKKLMRLPLLPGPPLLPRPQLVPGLPLLPGPPQVTGPPHGPMQMPSGNRRRFNRRQREPPFYSNASSGPRFPERHASGWSPDGAEHYGRGCRSGFMAVSQSNSEPYERHDSDFSPEGVEHYGQGYHSGFMSGSQSNSEPYEPLRQFKQGHSSGFSSGW